MARPNFTVKEMYVGNGSLSEYDFSFKVEDKSHLLVICQSSAGELVASVRGTDTSELLSSVTFDPVRGGGTVTLLSNLPSGSRLYLLLANDAPTQPSEFRQKGAFVLERIEAALDFLGGAIQRLAYLSKKSIKVNDLDSDEFETMIPPFPSDPKLKILQLLPDRTGMVWTSPEEIVDEGSAGATVPIGGETDQILTKLSNDDLDADWVDFGAEGFSQRYNETISLKSLRDVIAYIFNFSYIGPAVSFSASGSTSVYEKGWPIPSTLLLATITKRTDPIAAVRFYKGNDLIHTVTSPNPNGGTEGYLWEGTAFTDNTTFKVEVDDDGTSGGPTTSSATRTFTFVYPYYSGAGAPGVPASDFFSTFARDVVASTVTKSVSFNPVNGQVLYFAYPASYGALTSILDVNNFETLPDWELRTENITGLDGNAVSYNIYEFKNPLVAGSYTYTFKR
jgi:hypothetical protein